MSYPIYPLLYAMYANSMEMDIIHSYILLFTYSLSKSFI